MKLLHYLIKLFIPINSSEPPIKYMKGMKLSDYEEYVKKWRKTLQ